MEITGIFFLIAIMSVLNNVETCLGPIDTWPSYIIKLLFVDTPTPNIVKQYTAFMIGNGVNVDLAYDLYFLCNDEWCSQIKDDMYKFNFIWQRQLHKVHLC